MESRDRLTQICEEQLTVRGLAADKRFRDRLKWEVIEIDVQDLYDYFLDLSDRGIKLPNENNLLVPYLLGVCSGVQIDQEPSCTIGEFPDIDVDYLQVVRDYLKHDWAPRQFGQNRVAHIGTYGTYHANMALIDMARIFGKDRNEVLNVTTNLDQKDDEGNPLTWDKAVELYPAFRKYCDDHPDVADAAKRLCGRNRSIGQHAGGLIIAGCDLNEIVPLMGKDYELSTAWTEGQASTDLSSVGLVKFDMLILSTLQHIADCLALILKRHGLEQICALPGQPSWSDLSYLNDPKALKMADSGDLKMIFQFGSDGIRKLARRGGVTRFDDLVSYNGIYRPGPLQGKVDEMYCKRKRGEEQFEVHPVIEPILRKGYGLMIFQEDIMRVLNIVGKVPLRDCVAVIKAISKKKIEKFAKYKDMFIENGQKVLDRPKEYLEDLWAKIEFFAGYGFNLAHSTTYSYIAARQLYLKAHYPLEFYASGLNHIGADRDAKLREFKREVESHSIRLRRPNLNKSQVDFAIVDSDIYFGFSEIKGMGVDVSKRVVENQPYTGIEDFLKRFGTDAKVLQALIALRVFDDADPVVLYKYYEFFRKQSKKQSDVETRYHNSIQRYSEQVALLTGPELAKTVDLGDELSIDILADKVEPAVHKQVRRIATNFRRTNTNYRDHKEYFANNPLSLATFDPSLHEIEDKEMMEILQDVQKAEQKYFGFCWTHPLESCAEAKNFTFERYKMDNLAIGPVELLITKVTEKTGKVKYMVLNVEDLNWEGAQVTVWMDDYNRFAEELKSGALVRLRLKAPDGGFSRYTLDSPPRHKRASLPPKEQDSRVVVLNP